MQVTSDVICNRISLCQPISGYRVSVDPIILASLVRPDVGNTVLDVGCGVGAILLIIAHNFPDTSITGIERCLDIFSLAQENVRLNRLDQQVKLVFGDIFSKPIPIRESFDHVVSNPPYYTTEANSISSNTLKSEAMHISSIDLEKWLDFCIKRTRFGGRIYFIYPTSELSRILYFVSGRIGGIEIIPIWPKPNHPAKRFILVGTKGAKSPTKLFPGITIHQDDGRFTSEMNKILSV